MPRFEKPVPLEQYSGSDSDIVLNTMKVPVNTENIKQAAALLRDGQLVAFPTETVYGLGANALKVDAVEKIFIAKKRPQTNPLIVHISSSKEVEKYADTKTIDSETLDKLYSLWPGPLTLIMPKKEIVPDMVSAGKNTVALRVPNNPLALQLLEELDFPLAAPSANSFSETSPTEAKHVEQSLGSEVPLILDGGKCSVGLESTVLDLSSTPACILRPGAVSIEEIRKIIPEVSQIDSFIEDKTKPLTSPGLLKKHYSPKTPLYFFDKTINAEKVGAIVFSEKLKQEEINKFDAYVVLSKSGNLEEVASKLYSTLIAMDKLSLDAIKIDSCPKKGIGKAIMDRLERAVTSA